MSCGGLLSKNVEDEVSAVSQRWAVGLRSHKLD